MGAEAVVAGSSARTEDRLTRERLLLAGVRAFAARGFGGVSVREIERQAEVNRGLVGYHFGTKEQLWKDCFDWLMSGCHSEMQRYSEMLRVVSGPERRRVLLTAFVEYVSRHPELFRMLVIEGSEPSGRTSWAVAGLRETLRYFDALSGRPSDGPREDAAAAYMFLGAASLVFAVPAQCRYLFGLDTTDAAFVSGFSRTVVALGMLEPADTGAGLS